MNQQRYLTPTQLRVARAVLKIGSNATAQKVADSLGTSRSSVKNTLNAISDIIGVKPGVAAVYKAQELGLITVDE